MRERTLLVMVDGKTTGAELLARAKHMPDPQSLLAKLIDGGFIMPDAGGAVPAAAAAPSAPPQPSVQEAIRFARRYLNDNLGPDADMLMEPIERCKTAAELRARVEKTRDVLANVAGKRKAEEFWNGILPRLPQA